MFNLYTNDKFKMRAYLYRLQSSASCFSTAFKNLLLGCISVDVLKKFMHLAGHYSLFVFLIQNLILSF
jgi:hypothetical protein